jgi:hypothetical protein
MIGFVKSISSHNKRAKKKNVYKGSTLFQDEYQMFKQKCW